LKQNLIIVSLLLTFSSAVNAAPNTLSENELSPSQSRQVYYQATSEDLPPSQLISTSETPASTPKPHHKNILKNILLGNNHERPEPTPTRCQKIMRSTQNNPKWFQDYKAVCEHGKSLSFMLQPDVFASDLEILHHLFSDENADIYMRVQAAGAIADLWCELNKKHPTAISKTNFEAWRLYFNASWDSIDSGQAWSSNDECIQLRNALYAMKAAFNQVHANTPEGKKEAAEDEKNRVYSLVALWNDPAALKGKNIEGSFKVVEKTGEHSYLISLQFPDYEFRNYILRTDKNTLTKNEKIELVDGQMIRVLATVGGPYTYGNVLGGRSTVTELYAINITH